MTNSHPGWMPRPDNQVALSLTPDRHLTHHIGVGGIGPLMFQTTQDDARYIAAGGFWGKELPLESCRHEDWLILLHGVQLARYDMPGVALDLQRDANRYHGAGPPVTS